MMQRRCLSGLVLATAVFFWMSAIWADAPGTLVNLPLISSTQVQPNIMILIDNSGSMQNIVPDTPFDPSVTYFNCPSNITISSQSKIALYITNGSNIPYFYSSSNNALYDWGTGSSNGSSGKSQRCFDPTKNYTAALVANSIVNNGNCDVFATNLKFDRCTDTDGFTGVPYGASPYSGNYLNWYFGSTPTNWGSSAQSKPGAPSRIEVARSVLTAFVNGLSSVRVGLSQYDNASGIRGANIMVGLDDIGINLSAIVTGISSIGAAGGTPLASAVFELGRYFVQGVSGNLTLHPGQANQTTQSVTGVFPNTPLYNSGVVQSSPIQSYCQKSFIVLTTDGLPSQPTDNNNILNSKSKIIDYAGASGDPSSQLADVTNGMFDMDLRPDLVPTTGTKASKNNVATYTIGFADQALLESTLLGTAAALGGGQTYSALNTADLTDALQQAFESIAASVGTAAGLTFSTQGLSTNTTVFAPQYNSSKWSGELAAYPLSATGTVGSQLWSAATNLDAVAATNRVVITYNAVTNLGIPFRTLSSLSATQQADLNSSPKGSADTNGQARLNFLRGDRTAEGSTYRSRAHVLGDIVDSTPIYVGAPESNWPDTAPFPTSSGNKYSDFVKSSASTRTPVVYVGANDGMLHAFNASAGQDILSYIPNNLFSNAKGLGLHYLTDPAYQHRFYVNGTPVVQDAYITARSGGTQWRTVLVGSEGAGGRGYFALDITNPANFSEGNANNVLLWEFTSANTADLGYTFSAPVIGLMNNGRWAAIFGNGYNNTGTKTAKLFIVFLDGGLDGTWTAGTDYIAIDTQVSGNGLSSVAAIDVDGNKTIDRVYAGDVLGNMWAFDVSSASTANWKSAYVSGSKPQALFIAGNTQPITAKPLVIQNPAVGSGAGNQPNLLVLFGTGQYLTTDDPKSTKTQSFYGVWDAGKGGLTPSQLVTQTFTVSSGSRIMSNNSVPYSNVGTGKTYGWLINLTLGERVIKEAVVHSVPLHPLINTGPQEVLVFFDTLIPNVSSPCTFGGTGVIMGVAATTGGQPTQPIFDVNNDDQVTAADNINNMVVSSVGFTEGIPMGSSIRGDYLFTPVSSGTFTQTRIVGDSTLLGRISWREIMSGQN